MQLDYHQICSYLSAPVVQTYVPLLELCPHLCTNSAKWQESNNLLSCHSLFRFFTVPVYLAIHKRTMVICLEMACTVCCY